MWLPQFVKKIASALIVPKYPAANDAQDSYEEKKAFRKMMRARLDDYGKDFLRLQKDAECAYNLFVNSALYKESRTILAFVSCGIEMDTKAVIRTALLDGKRVAVPRVVPNTQDMDFYYLDNSEKLESQLERGAYDILEPKESLEKLEVQCLPIHTLIILPGLAFSKSGARLGRGKGFYDHFIEKLYAQKQVIHLPSALIGWCYEMQVFDEIPFCDHDAMLTHIITEKGFVHCE